MDTKVKQGLAHDMPKDQCPECGAYLGAHRQRCSQLNRGDAEAMRQARAIDDYLAARAR